jgi:hypothetical protein
MARRRTKKPFIERISPTWRHLAETPADVRFISAPDILVPSARTACRRLSWLSHPKSPVTSDTLARSIAHTNNSEIDWIPDSSMFLAHTDQVVWEALFATKRVKLFSPVISETEVWLADPTPRSNKLAHEVLNRAKAGGENAPVQFVDYSIDPVARFVVAYYARLIGFRKRLVELGRESLRQSLKREPSNSQVSNWIKDNFGVRSQRIARSGNESKVAAHRFNDEILVICCALNAICRGRETVIITRDEDIYEQFYKTMWMLDTQYRGMLMAGIYAKNPLEFRVHRVIDTEQRAFLGEVRLLERPSNLMTEVLPSTFTTVTVHCAHLHEGTSTQLSFTLEREMRSLLKTKFESKGLNTTLLEGQNCHIDLGAMSNKWGNYAAIGKDHVVHIGNIDPVSLAMIDLNLSLGSSERVERVMASPFIPPGFEH